MKCGCKYSFFELMKQCRLPDIQLCYALLELLREGKICQYREDEVVYELAR